jgi:SnoaL-like domain
MADEPLDMLTRWMEGYLRAWTSNAPDDIRALFTEDARYFTDPWSDPWQGQDGIVDGWLRREDQGDWTFDWSPVVATADVCVIQGETRYGSGTVYSNCWIIRLGPDGRAREFTEYWMDQADASEPA